MIDLNEYLNLIRECRQSEKVWLCETLHFVEQVCVKINKAEKDHHIQHVYDINVLEYKGLEETDTSNLIESIFSYQYAGDYPVWRSFVDTFYPNESELIASIEHPLFSAEEHRIDICIKEPKKYAFVVENKLKGAVFQRNQLGRYVHQMVLESFKLEDIFLIIIPGRIDPKFITHIRKSAWRAPKDWYKPNNERECCAFSLSEPNACRCDDSSWSKNGLCKGCIDYKECLKEFDGHLKVIDSEFTDWLMQLVEEDVVPKHEYLLRSAIIQFAYYIKGLYNIRLNQVEIMESIRVLEEQLLSDEKDPRDRYDKVQKTINDLDRLKQSLTNLLNIQLIRMWQKEIETFFPDARVDSDENSFGILIRREDAASIGDVNNGIYCGVWADTDKNYKPFWGFYSDSRKMMSEGAREMVDDIVKCAGASSKGEEGNYIAWDYTQHGSERVRDFLDAVVRLGFKYERKG